MISWWLRLRLVRAVLADVRLAMRLAREPQVSWAATALPIAAVLYVVAPLDLVPDLLPILGQTDDLGVLVLALRVFVRLCPSACVAYHQDQINKRLAYSPAPPSADVIDAEFHRG